MTLLSMNFSNLTAEGSSSFILALLFTIACIACFIYCSRRERVSKAIAIITAGVLPFLAVFCWVYLIMNLSNMHLLVSLGVAFASGVVYIAIAGVIALLVMRMKRDDSPKSHNNTIDEDEPAVKAEQEANKNVSNEEIDEDVNEIAPLLIAHTVEETLDEEEEEIIAETQPTIEEEIAEEIAPVEEKKIETTEKAAPVVEEKEEVVETPATIENKEEVVEEAHQEEIITQPEEVIEEPQTETIKEEIEETAEETTEASQPEVVEANNDSEEVVEDEKIEEVKEIVESATEDAEVLEEKEETIEEVEEPVAEETTEESQLEATEQPSQDESEEEEENIFANLYDNDDLDIFELIHPREDNDE